MQVERQEEEGSDFVEIHSEGARYRFEVVGDDEVELENMSTGPDVVQADRPQSPFDVPPNMLDLVFAAKFRVIPPVRVRDV